MNPILPSGAFFPKNAEGFLLNPCTVDLIDKRYTPVLKEVVDCYAKMEGANLHSVYLRGSVARGMNLGDCDLDTFALVFSEEERWKKPTWAAGEEERIISQFPFLTEIEFFVAGYAPVLRSVPGTKMAANAKTNPNLAMVIKTQSICLHGNDISTKIPPYRPDVRVMLYNTWLEKDISDFKSNKESEVIRQQALKTIIRSGFELVMPRIQQYTPDLYLCYRSFSDYHPKKEKWMRQILVAYLNPKETDPKDICKTVEEVGPWLVKQFKKQ